MCAQYSYLYLLPLIELKKLHIKTKTKHNSNKPNSYDFKVFKNASKALYY